ncbi:uncharacterized protein LOC111460327 isoform X2 [Cucurbita moschata]|uniref:Uncharacterized protein LOC111460327 isoform X2 n=1 Tax=Cucurbita moschata TaxID=3662 RepID=A0A6J1H4I4_CUCMO|nr:uncharacterized protein LOC111460327 isoform X2 [Cucurbita moschata]
MERRMKDSQTPQRDQAANRRSRKPLKRSSKQDFSSISVVSDVNQIPDIDRSFLHDVNPALSACCGSSLIPDLSPSSVVTFDNGQLDKVPVNFSGSNDLDETGAGSVGAEIAVSSLSRALTQVLQSTDVDHQAKKLIDASIRIIVDDFLAIPQDRDHIFQIISAKNQVLSISLFLWIIVLALAFLIDFVVLVTFEMDFAYFIFLHKKPKP